MTLSVPVPGSVTPTLSLSLFPPPKPFLCRVGGGRPHAFTSSPGGRVPDLLRWNPEGTLGRKSGAYKFEKRQKELARQKKRQEKLERKRKKQAEEDALEGGDGSVADPGEEPQTPEQ